MKPAGGIEAIGTSPGVDVSWKTGFQARNSAPSNKLAAEGQTPPIGNGWNSARLKKASRALYDERYEQYRN